MKNYRLETLFLKNNYAFYLVPTVFLSTSSFEFTIGVSFLSIEASVSIVNKKKYKEFIDRIEVITNEESL